MRSCEWYALKVNSRVREAKGGSRKESKEERSETGRPVHHRWIGAILKWALAREKTRHFKSCRGFNGSTFLVNL
jgi:hypothetical protein